MNEYYIKLMIENNIPSKDNIYSFYYSFKDNSFKKWISDDNQYII